MLVCAVVVFLTLPAGMSPHCILYRALTNLQTAVLDITIASIRALVSLLVSNFWFNKRPYYLA